QAHVGRHRFRMGPRLGQKRKTMGDRLNKIERIVGILLPAACREEVLGDLHERNSESRRYALDALRTVPMVIASRVRRMWNAELFAMYAGVLYLGLLGQDQFADRWLIPDAIPTVAALVLLALEDTYAGPARFSRLSLVRGRTLALGAALAFEFALHRAGSSLALPWFTAIRGSVLGLTWTLMIQWLYRRSKDTRRRAL
ncbi:MAG TPA: hypothetical protein VFW44_05430, partial [Bryobacteraceae bacterium]|nr:hypothetical protein [Bryobacteraceae bacterium]